MAQEGIFKNPILINQVIHKTVKVAKVDNFSFARDLNSVLVTGQEFLEASKHYPIVFVSGQNNDIVPLAILGLRDKGNLFIDDAGKWKDGSYLPAFIRRYPFILAENDPSGESFAVSVDAEYEGFDKEEGMSLFDDEGNSSDDLNRVLEFLKQYQIQNMLTQEFIKKLVDYNLLKDFSADITMAEGEKIGFRGMKMINEKALLELDDEKALDLFRRGFLGWIYGHLYSLSNFRTLGKLEAQKLAEGKAA
ncbi:MAG: SapC family protein [Deltaproteobacteria bacterium]|nr:MAG: SapC family protein [Deltaproteobacteria bacterium]